MRSHVPSEWFTPVRFAGVLGLLLALTFPLAVTGLNAFTYLDSGLFAYPVAYYHRECFWRGELPLWNPLNNCGLPFLAQWNTLVLYPLSLLYLLLPLPWSFNIFCLGHLFLAGLGMYFLARKWTGSHFAGAFAGAVFAFNGLTWYGLMWPHIISAAAWTPWLVLAAEAAWHRGGQFVIVAGMVGAVQMLTGGAEVILQTWLFLGGLLLHRLLRGGVPWTRLGLRALAVGLIVITLAAAQLLPFLDLLQFSQRSGSFGDASVAAMPLSGWANFLVPLFHFCRNVQGIFVPAKLSWTGSWYLGVGTVALALAAFLRVRDSRVRLLMVMSLLSLLMALGDAGVLYKVLKAAIPQLGFIRFPVKFIFLAVFALPLAAAFAIARLEQLSPEKWAVEWKRVSSLVIFLVAAMGLILVFAWLRPLPKDDFGATALGGFFRVLFLLGAVAAVALLRTVKAHGQVLLQVGVVALTWFDIYTHGSDLSPTVPAGLVRENAVRTVLKWNDELRAGDSRAMLTSGAIRTLLTVGSAQPEVDTQGRRLALYMNFNLLDHVPKTDGLFSLELRDYDAFRNLHFLTNEASGLKDFLGVSHVSNPTNVIEWDRRDSFLPFVTGGQRPVFAEPSRTLKALLADDFEPLKTVYLPPELKTEVNAGAAAMVTVRSRKFSGHRLEIDAEADTPALLVVAQSYYHRWRAYVDGAPVPLWRANFAFQCVQIPAGRHRVLLAYRDQAFLAGTALSLAGLLFCVASWFWCRRARRESGRVAQPGEKAHP